MSQEALPIKNPVRNQPFAPWPSFQDEEVEAASRVLRSGKVNYWTGQECRLFEQEFAEFVGTKYAIALANGTVALELALVALGIGPGDEVVTTSRTFIASASAIVMRGAVPVIADVDPVSQNLTAETVERVLSPRTRAVVAVHLAGWPCEMDALQKLARKKQLKLIEDCAQAHGACYKGKQVGSLGDIAAFSFCQDKIMTTGGEGGMVTTNDRSLWERAWAFKDHGKSVEAMQYQSAGAGFRWLHDSFGTNWRMTEMQAAIGRVALKRLPQWVDLRRRNAEILRRYFKNRPELRVTEPVPTIQHAYYKYYTFLRPHTLRPEWDRERIVQHIAGAGVPCFSGCCSEIYLEKAFEALPRRGKVQGERLTIAKALGETSLMFLVHPTLDIPDMNDTCLAVGRVLDQARI